MIMNRFLYIYWV